jgi:hypothetical protein
LFEYGSDQDIVANLRALPTGNDSSVFVVGSVTRNDELSYFEAHQYGRYQTARVGRLQRAGGKAGWNVTRGVARPLSDQVVLEPKRELSPPTKE